MTDFTGYTPIPTLNPYDPSSMPARPPRTSGFAIASLICGAVGLITCCTEVPGLLGIVFGVVALPAIARGQASGRGMAIGGIVLGIIGMVLGIVVWVVIMLSPEVAPVPGVQVPQRQRDALRQMGVLHEGEQIELLYYDGLVSLKEGGVLITDHRVVVFSSGPSKEACALKDVQAIDYTPASGWFGEANFVLDSEDGNTIVFTVGGQDKGDQLFYQVLKKRVAEERKAAGRPESHLQAPSLPEAPATQPSSQRFPGPVWPVSQAIRLRVQSPGGRGPPA